jgi:tetratricopeptide (TPR) repeat protein
VDHETEQVIDEGVVTEAAAAAVRRGRSGGGRALSPRSAGASRSGTSRRRRQRATDSDLVARLSSSVGPKRAERLANRMAEAAGDFAEEHLDDAARIMSGIAREAPEVAEVRELLGLIRYRQGRWRPAIKELEAFGQLTGSVEQHAVLADCYRALGNHTEVANLWDELRRVSPDAALVTEGRIVAAGDLADQDRLAEAISLLSRGWRWPKRARDYHLRRAYVLADLYERAGDLPAARSLFDRVAAVDPELGGAASRAAALR